MSVVNHPLNASREMLNKLWTVAYDGDAANLERITPSEYFDCLRCASRRTALLHQRDVEARLRARKRAF